MNYKIGEIAKILGISASAIRYYEKEGLLPKLGRSENGVRIFSDADLALFKIIECLKHTGMPIKDIREFIKMLDKGDETITARRELFEKRREELKKQLDDLQKTMEIVEYKCWFYETAEKEHSTERLSSLSVDEIPARFREAKRRLLKTDISE